MRHEFIPDHYHITLGPHDPVLSVRSGDTIVTTTVDARGYDHRREQITPRGNPQTGPFFIEEAEPGDTLVVRLDRIEPNREIGWSLSAVAANVVDPEFVPSLPASEVVEWRIDQEKRTATLLSSAFGSRSLSLPLEPMLGCFGVAPARSQAISTATSGPYGGNMDYRGFVAGTTVYFPVFEPGALLFVGDGHAVQGCGEICGTGIEISMDVELTVSVLKGKTIGWPRGENDREIFTVGCARPLDQCVQHATTEMLKWLTADYGLDAVAASLLLQQAVRYDLGNVFDPAYAMVCKLPKSVLQEVAG